MKALLDNAYLRLGLTPADSIDAARRRRDEIRQRRKSGEDVPPEEAVADALRRLEDPGARLHEAVFAGGEAGSAWRRAAERHAELLRQGGTAADWLAALKAWTGVLGEARFQSWVHEWAAQQRNSRLGRSEVDRFLEGLPLDLLVINVNLGMQALARKDAAQAKLHGEVLLGAPVEEGVRRKAIQVMTEALAEEIEKSIGRIAGPVEALAAAKKLASNAEVKLAEAAQAAQAAVASRIGELEAFGPGAGDPPRDALAQLLRRIALLRGRTGGAAEGLKRGLEDALAAARSESIRKWIAEDVRDPAWAVLLDEAGCRARRGEVEGCRRALAALRASTKDPERIRLVDERLNEPRAMMGPPGSLPPLGSLNGFGVHLYGDRDRDADGTYVTTACVCAVFVPVFPLGAYLVSPAEGNNYRFFGRVPLSAFARTWRRMILLGAPAMVAALIGWGIFDSSDYAREREALRIAATHIEAGQAELGLQALARVEGTSSPERARRRDELRKQAVLVCLGRIRSTGDFSAFLATGVADLPQDGPQPAVFDAGLDAEILRVLETAPILALPAGGGPPSSPVRRDFETRGRGAVAYVAWACDHSPALGARRYEIARAAALRIGYPQLHEYALRFAPRGDGPEDLLVPFEAALRACRHDDWAAHFQAFRRRVREDRAESVFLSHLRGPWLGIQTAEELRGLEKELPAPLQALFSADAVADPDLKLAALKPLESPPGLTEPAAAWHRAGHARRMAFVLRDLNDLDPERTPIQDARKWAAIAAEGTPEDAEIAAFAMKCALAVGDAAAAIALGELAPRQGEALAWLGTAYARAGRLADAEKTLDPYVAANLPAYAAAWSEWSTLYDQVSAALFQSLQNGTADQFLIQRLNSLSDEEAQREAEAWVRRTVDGNGRVRELEARWTALGPARFAARELAMVRLALGRDLPPGDARRRQLAEAERLFLDIRKISGGDDEEDLGLLRVYLWLGKEEESRALIEGLEKRENGEVMLELGEAMRELGRYEAARKYFEDAYRRLPKEKRDYAARLRAIASVDADDRLAWLERCEAKTPLNRVDLAEARARKAIEDRRWAEATELLREGQKYWAGMPENPSALNNAAVNRFDAWIASGDPACLRDAMRSLKRALELEPDGAIVGANRVHALSCYGIHAIAGSSLQSAHLHEFPSADWLDYVDPEPTRSELAKRMAGQAELREAADLGARVAVLCPDDDDSFDAQSSFARRSGDLERLRRLRLSLEASPPARPEAKEAAARFHEGKWTDEERKNAEHRLISCREKLAAARQAANRPTLGYLMTRFAVATAGAARLGAGDATLDHAVALGEEAVAAFDGPDTRENLVWILGERASDTLAREEEPFKSFVSCAQDLSGIAALWLWKEKNPAVAARVKELAGLARAAELAAKQADSPSRAADLSDWLALSLMDHPRAAEVATRMTSERLELESVLVHRLLDRHGSNAVLYAWAAARVCGETRLAGDIAAEARRDGVLPGFFGGR
ncbi:MAG: hypothetical protein HYY18_22480 [Planctomycetes bacterium]|nr:hypothetical protein [Planctomycetota bacterium]